MFKTQIFVSFLVEQKNIVDKTFFQILFLTNLRRRFSSWETKYLIIMQLFVINSFSAKVAFWRLCVVLLTGLFHLEITNPGKKEFLKSVYRNKSYLALKLD